MYAACLPIFISSMVSAAVAFTIGVLWFAPSTGAAPAHQAAAPVLRAERFELVDGEGKPRARLGIEADRSVGLAVLDQGGIPRVLLGVTTDDRPIMGFLDQTSQQRTSWTLTPDGVPSMLFHNPQHGTVVIGAFGDGAIGLGVLDVSRQPRVRLVMTPDGGEGLMLSDATGQPRLVFGLQSDGTPNVGQLP
jgi:hypothetical protein